MRAKRVQTLLAFLVLALLVATTAQVWRIREANALEDERAAALAAAREEVGILVSISAETSDHDIDMLLAGGTDEFRDDFEAQAENFRQQLVAGQVVSTGEVTSAGLVSSTESTAIAVVAATGSVTNDRTETAEPRFYRLRVDLEKVNDEWLVSRLEFVP